MRLDAKAVRSLLPRAIVGVLAASILSACQMSFQSAGIHTTIPAELAIGPLSYGNVNGYAPFLVVLRYPSRVDQAALPTMRRAIRASASGIPQVAGLGDSEIDRAIASQMAKTMYYSLELYQYLSRFLPEGTVALQPTMIASDARGRLRETTPNTLPPSILILDFHVVVSPIDILAWGDHTFGHWITPEIGLTTSFQAWPSTTGTIATRGAYEPSFFFNPLIGAAGAGRVSYAMDLNKVTGFTLAVPSYKEQQYGDLPIKWDRLLQLPKITYEMTPEEMVLQAVNPARAYEEPPARALYDMVTRIVVGALRVVDPYLAARDAWHNYIELYDPELAIRWPRAPLSEIDRKRLTVIRQFAETERRFVTKQDLDTVRDAYRGVWGSSMRQLFSVELDARKRTAEAVDRTNALMMVAMMTAGIGGNVAEMGGQLAALDKDLGKQAAALAGTLRKHFDRVQDQQVRETHETAGVQAVIEGHTLAQLREEMKKLYVSRMPRRSAEEEQVRPLSGREWVADRRTGCNVFVAHGSTPFRRGPIEALDVEWSGACRDGKADGYGMARFFKHGYLFEEIEGTFKAGVVGGRASGLLAVECQARDCDSHWRSPLAAREAGQPQDYILYFVEGEIRKKTTDSDDPYEFTSGRIQTGGRYLRADGQEMTPEEVAAFEADRRQFRAFRLGLLPTLPEPRTRKR